MLRDRDVFSTTPGATRLIPLLPRAVVLLLTAPSAMAGQEPGATSDFPTIERVLFVEACARDRPERSHTEMLYKCACVIDVLASRLRYEEYVEASTAFYASQAAGERGTTIRESSTGRELADRFRSARAEAARQCMLP